MDRGCALRGPDFCRDLRLAGPDIDTIHFPPPFRAFQRTPIFSERPIM